MIQGAFDDGQVGQGTEVAACSFEKEYMTI